MTELETRAAEIAAFLGIPVEQAIERLSKGFGFQHQAVNDDYRRANIKTDEHGVVDPVALLNWYRTTEQYIWELTSYHLDPGFNYAGMCSGIAERLKAEGKHVVLCLGDGIGDLTIALKDAGLDAWYHDLAGSKTAEFAAFRFKTWNAKRPAGTLCIHPDVTLAETFDPKEIRNLTSHGCRYGAIVSLDFLEHVDGVPMYVQAIYDALLPGGLMLTQNAFGCGSGPDGSIPMHLTKNDIYVYEWDNLCASVGFQLEVSNWYRKP